MVDIFALAKGHVGWVAVFVVCCHRATAMPSAFPLEKVMIVGES